MEIRNKKNRIREQYKENIEENRILIQEKVDNVIEEWETFKGRVVRRNTGSETCRVNRSPVESIQSHKDLNGSGLIFPKRRQNQRKPSVLHTDALIQQLERCKIDLVKHITLRRCATDRQVLKICKITQREKFN